MKKIVITYFILPFLTLALWSFTSHKNKAKINDKFVVVLDAGHGGHDPGNLGGKGSGLKEKEIALKIVLSVGKILEQNPGIKVIYTRKTDVFVDLYERGQIANKANADLFVSVHCNSHNSKAHGTETFVLGLHANKQNFEVAKKENQVIYLEENYEAKYAGYDINSPESVIGLTIMQEEFLDQSIDLARRIQENFTNKLKRVNRGVKQAGFIVLHQTYMPSVLVETGFLTYKDEGRYLNSARGQNDMARSIANAIIDYKKTVQTNVGEDTSFEVVNNTAENIKNPPGKETGKEKEEKKNVPVAVKKETPAINANNQTQDKPDEIKKQPVVKTEKKEESVIYKVQLAATTRKIPLKSENFNGLTDLSTEPFNKFFRYMYGSVKTYREATALKVMAVKKGYPSCYIVAYKNGVRIPITEEMQSQQ